MCTNESCTIRPEAFVKKVNRVNFNFTLTVRHEMAVLDALEDSVIRALPVTTAAHYI